MLFLSLAGTCEVLFDRFSLAVWYPFGLVGVG